MRSASRGRPPCLDNLPRPQADSPHFWWSARAFVSGSTMRHRAGAQPEQGGQAMPRGAKSATRALAVLTMGLVLIAGAGPAAAQGKPIRIGEINSYSGLATVYTFPYKEGLLMAVKEINDAGGVNGRPIEFIFRDD